MKLYKKISAYKDLHLFIFSLIFIFLNAYIVLSYSSVIFLILPLLIIITLILIKHFELIFYFVVFLTPFSISLKYFLTDLSFDFSIFTEPLLVILLIIITTKFLIKRKIEKSILTHTISKIIIIILLWTFITAAFSSLPIISLKFFLAKVWFIIPLFFLGLIIFKDYDNIKPFIWAYSIGLFIIVLYSTYNLSHVSFTEQNAAHFVVKPFYNDHTEYGSVVAFFTPIFWGFAFNLKKGHRTKIIAFIFAIAFTIATILSYSRASWLGLIAAFGVWVIVKLRFKFKYIVFITVFFAAFFAAFWFQIIDKLENNKQDSSSKLSSHISSITNISTDASNVERLNRWHCAIEMFKEKPVLGWGPGTYQFQYAPFQLERMRTIISTNFGDVGNAHSEYLGRLAEQGLPGMILFIFLVFFIIRTGLKVYKKTKDKEIRMFALSITLGFITYFLHGLMNNFLDSDKLAVPFWGLAAILVALDLYHTNPTKTDE